MAIPLMAIAGGLQVATGIFGAIQGGKAARRARNEESKNRAEMDRLKSVYANLDTSNPYLNMENTMEDLTVNQQEAQFLADQNQRTQANTLDALRVSAGGSGIASLAQSLAQQGQLNAQRASASIGQQEAMNQRLASQQASRIQTLERQGEVMSRNWRRDQVGTLLGMSQQETAAARQQAAMAQQAKMQAISSSVSGLSSLAVAQMKYGNNPRKPVDQISLAQARFSHQDVSTPGIIDTRQNFPPPSSGIMEDDYSEINEFNQQYYPTVR